MTPRRVLRSLASILLVSAAIGLAKEKNSGDPHQQGVTNAVESGVLYLLSQQAEDGSWEGQTRLTARAARCLIAAGHGDAAASALQWLEGRRVDRTDDQAHVFLALGAAQLSAPTPGRLARLGERLQELLQTAKERGRRIRARRILLAPVLRQAELLELEGADALRATILAHPRPYPRNDLEVLVIERLLGEPPTRPKPYKALYGLVNTNLRSPKWVSFVNWTAEQGTAALYLVGDPYWSEFRRRQLNLLLRKQVKKQANRGAWPGFKGEPALTSVTVQVLGALLVPDMPIYRPYNLQGRLPELESIDGVKDMSATQEGKKWKIEGNLIMIGSELRQTPGWDISCAVFRLAELEENRAEHLAKAAKFLDAARTTLDMLGAPERDRLRAEAWAREVDVALLLEDAARAERAFTCYQRALPEGQPVDEDLRRRALGE